jgi:hypothetical protein
LTYWFYPHDRREIAHGYVYLLPRAAASISNTSLQPLARGDPLPEN